MKYLATLWFWAVFGLTVVPGFLVGVALWLVTLPFDPDRRVLHAYVCRWCFQYLRCWPGWSVRVTGRERLPAGPCVLVANHQSMADIFAAMGLFHPFKFVSKASLFRIPMVGWMMSLLRYVRVERGRPQSMREMLDVCRAWLHGGMPVLIFPEGTYAEGGRLLPFRRGAFRLALDEKLPVVPVVLEGTTDLVEGDGPWMNPRAHVRVQVLPPVQPEDFGADDGVLADRVRGLFLQALGSHDSSG
ncbi:1-acyl-sn-glycerol-3-phosphate acyltransferase [Vitiosangium sp. GDMCC 1.1324]|uniref:lysophospholipid acyltransferase family protein n=1 Tax=Vitiosangium sp. (strain GDMCC 1.1324) TaxID=2138576 RepID=UPI000D3A367A|nr:lysophospholipid acyltransferase family protein [Vitiosangium sp. GDMCC 1.1324]PTL81772.1 1-acyl-sn-glycerol-3-phosphate acyltransferase [Vitiosangium sp. GDMCC 1.1324]